MSIISKSRELIDKLKLGASTVGKNIIQSTPQNMANVQNVWNRGVQNVKSEWQRDPTQFNLFGLMARGSANTGIKPVDYLSKNVGSYLNTYIQAAKDIPSAVKQTFTPGKTNIAGINLPNSLVGVGRTAFDVLGAVPDPSELFIAPANYLKGIGKAKLEGKKGWDVTNTGVEAMSYKSPVGLGEAITTNPLGQTIGNVAELPLLIGFMGGIKKGTNIGFDKKLITKFKNDVLQDKEARSAIQEFSTFMETTSGKGAMPNQLGYTIQTIMGDLFGREKVANLTNKQIYNILDVVYKQAGDQSLFQVKRINPGLSIQNVREKLPQLSKNKGLPKIPAETPPLSPTEGVSLIQAQKGTPLSVKPEVTVPEVPTTLAKTTKQTITQSPEIQSQLKVNPLASEVVSGQKSSQAIIPQSLNPTDPYFNVEKLNITIKQKKNLAKVVEETKPQIEAVVGKKLTNKEAVQFSNVTSKVLNRAVPRAETLAWEAKILNARKLLAEQAKNGTVTQDYIDNLVAVKSAGTDIARKLQSLGVVVDPSEITAKQAILESILKVVDDTDAIIKKANGVDFNNYEQATNFYRQFVKPNISDWLDKIRYTSMLSSPQTHINNFLSNWQGTGMIEPLVKTIEGGVDFLRSSVTGGKRTRFAGEGVEYLKGYYSKLGEASHKFANIMKGKEFSSMSELYNLPLTKAGTTARKFENTQTFFPKLLQGMDEFFQVLTKGGLESSGKYRVSKGGRAVAEDVVAKEAKKLLFNAEFNLKEEGPLLKALEYIPSKVMEARNSANPVVSTIAKYTFPFVRIPSNILKASVEYSPLGVTTMIGAGDKTRQLSKAILGTSIGLGTAMLVGSDRMTWAYPTDPTRKKAMEDAGIKPYSIKLGNKWVSYSKLHPAIAFNLALVAAIRDADQNKKLDDTQVETLLNGVAKWVNFFADQSYVKNIGDFVSAAKGDLTGLSRYISNYPQQLIPFRAMLGWINKITDPYQRQVDPTGSQLEKTLQNIAIQIPGLSQTLQPKTDEKGQPIKRQYPVLNALSPYQVSKEDPDKAILYKFTLPPSQVYNFLKEQKDPEVRKRYVIYLKEKYPVKYANVMKYSKDVSLKTTGKEVNLRNLSVSQRATSIKFQMDKLKTPEEKSALFKDYVNKGIITKEVSQQLNTLFNQ